MHVLDNAKVKKPLWYKVLQIWPGLFVGKQVTVCPGHIWTTLYVQTSTSLSAQHPLRKSKHTSAVLECNIWERVFLLINFQLLFIWWSIQQEHIHIYSESPAPKGQTPSLLILNHNVGSDNITVSRHRHFATGKPTAKRDGWTPQKCFEWCGENSLPLPRIEPRHLDCPARSLITTPTTPIQFRALQLKHKWANSKSGEKINITQTRSQWCYVYEPPPSPSPSSSYHYDELYMFHWNFYSFLISWFSH